MHRSGLAAFLSAALLGCAAADDPSTAMADEPKRDRTQVSAKALERPLAADAEFDASYIALHHAVLDPAAPQWPAAVKRLADAGDGYTLMLLRAEGEKLSPENVRLAQATIERIQQREATVAMVDFVQTIDHRLKRAARVDLGCDRLEGSLVPWTLDTIRAKIDDPAVRKELERIRDDRPPGKLDAIAAMQADREREYVARLLTPAPRPR